MTIADPGTSQIPADNPENKGEKCPKCGAMLSDVTEDVSKLQFCPICGADLKASKQKIKVHPASFGIRFGAWLLDIVFISFIFWLIFNAILNFQFENYIPPFLERLGERFPNLPAVIVRGYTFNAITFLYFFVNQLAGKGQTLGKLIVGYRKVNRNTLQTRTKFGWIFLDSLFKGMYLFLLIDVIAGLVQPGPEKYYRWTQKKEQAVIIKKISPEKAEKEDKGEEIRKI